MKQTGHNNHKTNTHYSITLNKSEKDFDLAEIKRWIEHYCVGSVSQNDTKNNITFKFKNIDDAFKFKLHWVRA